MVNINNKPRDKLRFRDIEKFLSESGDEHFFFEECPKMKSVLWSPKSFVNQGEQEKHHGVTMSR